MKYELDGTEIAQACVNYAHKELYPYSKERITFTVQLKWNDDKIWCLLEVLP